jgi:CDP-glycerol glycerophosphotransferase (TagB/SpsB family)
MSKRVLFTSQRPYGRAENISAAFDAYDGEKDFVQLNMNCYDPAILSGKYDLMVTDEYPAASPGKVILLWHAIAGGKLIGLRQPHPYAGINHMARITYVATSGTGAVPIIINNTGLPEKRIIPTGMPRTDAYINKKKGDGCTPLAGKKYAYLYAPTFRTGNETPMPNLDWKIIDLMLTNREGLFVKPHMLTGKLLNCKHEHIYEVYSGFSSAPYLIDCDVLITDYSSIMFDAYLLGKPCVLIEKNPGYTQTRGMYLKYPDEYSSRFCDNEHDMIRLCRGTKELTDIEKDVIHKVADMCDGHACERVCDLIKKTLEE